MLGREPAARGSEESRPYHRTSSMPCGSQHKQDAAQTPVSEPQGSALFVMERPFGQFWAPITHASHVSCIAVRPLFLYFAAAREHALNADADRFAGEGRGPVGG